LEFPTVGRARENAVSQGARAWGRRHWAALGGLLALAGAGLLGPALGQSGSPSSEVPPPSSPPAAATAPALPGAPAVPAAATAPAVPPAPAAPPAPTAPASAENGAASSADDGRAAPAADGGGAASSADDGEALGRSDPAPAGLGTRQGGYQDLLWQSLAAVLVILALGGAGLFFVRRVMPRVAASRGRQVALVETFYLGPQKALHLVQVGGRRLLVGATRERLALVADVTDDVPPAEAAEAPAGAKKRFTVPEAVEMPGRPEDPGTLRI